MLYNIPEKKKTLNYFSKIKPESLFYLIFLRMYRLLWMLSSAHQEIQLSKENCISITKNFQTFLQNSENRFIIIIMVS